MTTQETVIYRDNNKDIVITNLRVMRGSLTYPTSRISAVWARKSNRGIIAGLFGWSLLSISIIHSFDIVLLALVMFNPSEGLGNYVGVSFITIFINALGFAVIFSGSLLLLYLTRGKYQVMIEAGAIPSIFVQSHDKEYILKISEKISEVITIR